MPNEWQSALNTLQCSPPHTPKGSRDLAGKYKSVLGDGYQGIIYSQHRFGVRVTYAALAAAQTLLLTKNEMPSERSLGLVPETYYIAMGMPVGLYKSGAEELLALAFGNRAIAIREKHTDTRN